MANSGSKTVSLLDLVPAGSAQAVPLAFFPHTPAQSQPGMALSHLACSFSQLSLAGLLITLGRACGHWFEHTFMKDCILLHVDLGELFILTCKNIMIIFFFLPRNVDLLFLLAVPSLNRMFYPVGSWF